MTYLLDANVLIARCFPDHIHHRDAVEWLNANPNFAICPITEGALVRFWFRTGAGSSVALQSLMSAIHATNGFEFWPNDISYRAVATGIVTGHAQVTDAYLVALAAHHGGRLATFDSALATLHPSASLIAIR